MSNPIAFPTGSPRACLVALTHCGRVVAWARADGDLAHEWAGAMRTAGWQVGTMTHSELLQQEPACATCRFTGSCIEARKCLAAVPTSTPTA